MKVEVLAIVIGTVICTLLIATSLASHTQAREKFTEVCSKAKGTTVYNGKNWECIK